jgi:hypothetical protein
MSSQPSPAVISSHTANDSSDFSAPSSLNSGRSCNFHNNDQETSISSDKGIVHETALWNNDPGNLDANITIADKV